MRHARSQALDDLEPVLDVLRTFSALREKSRGVFSRGGTAFLHFHEDPTGLFADVRLGVEFERLRVSTERERDALVRRIRGALGAD